MQSHVEMIKPGEYAIGAGSYRTVNVRSCVAVVIEPPNASATGQNARGILHFNGNASSLAAFLEQAKAKIPDGVAKLAGASSFVGTSSVNLETVLSALAKNCITIAAKDLGGYYQRIVTAGPDGTFSYQREYDPFSSAAAGLFRSYYALEERAEILKL